MDVEPFSLPLSRPLETAAGAIESREGFLVEVTIDGVDGVGEATPLPGWTEPPEVCGRALRDIEQPRTALEGDELADAPAARHGVTLAVLDAAARAAGQPLYRYLGAPEHRESVPVNATVGDGPPAETASAAENAVNEGYPAVKLKVGVRPPAADIDRIEAVRRRCPDVELRVDANGAWSGETALEIVPRLAALGVAVVEQPLSAEELAGHAELRGRGVAIAVDEGLLEHSPRAVLAAEAADILVCKPMALGGIDRARDVVETARAEGIDALVTTTIDGAIARAGAVHLAASVPEIRACGLATAGLLASDIRDGIATVEGGSVPVSQGKGNIPPR
ncbi:o-succinylbenzoate synthase [Natronomonas sp. F2-12]|uniref:o-succinylbenzoate synthase n=1 Tax=Natronomonas aquatica TaxID=2841590 RepID=A0A9R1CSE9_9EURY|nr:o-succinylbenzoate synthase [Natronomonas aquatica]MCQ4334354.1 o-succinylbenzoate synthase [Natronomonas aquatica]